MRTLTALAMILFASCNRQNEAVKVNVPDTVYVVRDMPKQGDHGYAIDDKGKLRPLVVTGWLYTIRYSDADDWSNLDFLAPQVVYFDSLSACRALSERLEKQRDELNEKLGQLKCEGK